MPATCCSPLDRDAVRHAARELKAEGVQSIAVCYLFSFMNPAHERRDAQRSSSRNFPASHVSLSSEVLPRIREWPRLSTTLLNAYLEPVMVRYIDHLNQGLDKIGIVTQQRFLMQSNGGVMPFSAAIAGGRTVHTLFSGPGRRRAGERLSRRERGAARGLVTLDMGGTSCDIAFIEGGVPLETTEGVDRAPAGRRAGARHDHDLGRRRLDRLDRRRRLPQRRARKAPAPIPGPACYGRGGTQPTVTDADVRLRLSQSRLFPRRHAEARRRRVARRAGEAHRQAR